MSSRIHIGGFSAISFQGVIFGLFTWMVIDRKSPDLQLWTSQNHRFGEKITENNFLSTNGGGFISKLVYLPSGSGRKPLQWNRSQCTLLPGQRVNFQSCWWTNTASIICWHLLNYRTKMCIQSVYTHPYQTGKIKGHFSDHQPYKPMCLCATTPAHITKPAPRWFDDLHLCDLPHRLWWCLKRLPNPAPPSCQPRSTQRSVFFWFARHGWLIVDCGFSTLHEQREME